MIFVKTFCLNWMKFRRFWCFLSLPNVNDVISDRCSELIDDSAMLLSEFLRLRLTRRAFSISSSVRFWFMILVSWLVSSLCLKWCLSKLVISVFLFSVVSSLDEYSTRFFSERSDLFDDLVMCKWELSLVVVKEALTNVQKILKEEEAANADRNRLRMSLISNRIKRKCFEILNRYDSVTLMFNRKRWKCFEALTVLLSEDWCCCWCWYMLTIRKVECCQWAFVCVVNRMMIWYVSQMSWIWFQSSRFTLRYEIVCRTVRLLLIIFNAQESCI